MTEQPFTEHMRVLAVAQAANVPVTLGHEELAILLDALIEQETELADLKRQLAAARERIAGGAGYDLSIT